jgi:iron(III) transport system substrate-binding protein
MLMRLVLLALLLLELISCQTRDDREVVVYSALDRTFSEPVLQRFEKETGVRVRAVYDVEATKTVGLVNRIISEAENPRCDVFWNNEVVRTIVLKRRGLLERYVSPRAEDIPPTMKDPEGFWTGFAARARILIYNKALVADHDLPSSIADLVEERWRGKVSMAYPLFGTTATHAAALFAVLGADSARAYFARLRENEIVIVDGNASSKDAVARGEVLVGSTDTDDALVAMDQGKPVGIVFPDQGEGELGTLVIPNTVALIRGCPHPREARMLVDFLLRHKTEEELARSGSGQIPVRCGIPVPAGVRTMENLKAMTVDWNQVEEKVDDSAKYLERLFVQ